MTIRSKCLTYGDTTTSYSSMISSGLEPETESAEYMLVTLCKKPGDPLSSVMATDMNTEVRPKGICRRCWDVLMKDSD